MIIDFFNFVLIDPIFNLLVAIYGLVPGHNFGVAIIVFTIVARTIMWPIVRRQLHHAKAMRELQPEIKKIKKEAGGDRQKVAVATMALYKQREINPLASIGYLLIQLPIFIALYQGVNGIANNPEVIVNESYSFVSELPYIQELDEDISRFDQTAIGGPDLTRRAIEDGSIYWGAMVFVILSAAIQYLSSKQLMASRGEKKSLRKLMREQAEGKDVDQAEISEAAGRFTLYLIPGIIFFVSLGFVAALPFYWFINGFIGYVQQRRILGEDKQELLEAAEVNGEAVEAEIVSTPKKMNAKQKREAMKRGQTTGSKTKATRSKKRAK